MQKLSKAALAVLAGLLPGVAMATGPVSLRGENGSTFTVPVSQDNPNVLMVQGERIAALTSKGSDIPGAEKTGNGAMLFYAVVGHPFTFVVETESGQVFSLRAMPVKGQGRVYRITSASLLARPVAQARERSEAYESLLIALSRGVLDGQMPDGYVLADADPQDVVLPVVGRATQFQVWRGDSLQVERYRLTNTGARPLALREQALQAPGVRAVMFWPRSASLPAGATVTLTLIREQAVAP
ncbi:conjugal transfer pilus assembly protein TraK [Cedecea sp. NFIX57]|nr:conjugal transfer pilus assembly protein TraK [Cedecea sp. NFIX57]